MYIIKGGSAVIIYGEPPYQLEKDNPSEKWAKKYESAMYSNVQST